MIIERLRAENFMQYEVLALEDLPRKAAVAIVGENECGKTTIGECISFALFGHTRKTIDTDPAQVIHWDADEARVVIDLDVDDMGRFRLERTIDRYGEYDARLSDPESGATFARGPRAVARKVEEMLRITFDLFRTTFYLGQGELDIVRHEKLDNTRRLVERMLGLTDLEEAGELLEEEMEDLRSHRDRLRNQLAVSETLLAESEADPAAIEACRRELAAVSDQIKSAESSLPDLESRAEAAREALDIRSRLGEAMEHLRNAILHERHHSLFRDSIGEIEGTLALLGAEEERLEALAEGPGEAETDVDHAHAYARAFGDLKTRIDLYRERIERELDERVDDDGDALPETKADRRRVLLGRAEELGAARRTRLLWSGVWLVLALASGGGALALLLDGSISPGTIGLADVGIPVVATALGVLGGLFAMAAILLGWGAVSLGRRIQQVVERAGRLEAEIDELRREKEIIEGLDEGRPAEFVERLEGLRSIEIANALADIREEYEDLLAIDLSPEDLFRRAEEERAEARQESEEATASLAEVRRLRAMADRFLADVPEVLRDPEAEEAEVDPPEEPVDLEELERDLHLLIQTATDSQIRARAHRRRATGGEDASIKSPDQAFDHLEMLLDSFFLTLEACGDPDGGGGRALAERGRDRWKQSGIHELIDGFADRSVETVQSVIDREFESLEEVLPGRNELEDTGRRLMDEYRRIERSMHEEGAKQAGLETRYEHLVQGADRAEQLRDEADRLRRELAPIEAGTRARERAVELLAECAEELRDRAGPALARYMAYILPRITKNRYRTVRVTPELDIRVFSNERNDFVRLIDLSAGTADQILLALRLSLAEALMISAGHEGARQFLFLDEPMASFDAERMAGLLEFVRECTGTFAQIFIVSHDPAAAEHCDLVIRPELGEDRLEVSGDDMREAARHPVVVTEGDGETPTPEEAGEEGDDGDEADGDEADEDGDEAGPGAPPDLMTAPADPETDETRAGGEGET